MSRKGISRFELIAGTILFSVCVFFLIISIPLALCFVAAFFGYAALYRFFGALRVERIEKYPKTLNLLILVCFLGISLLSLKACKSTIVRSPSTIEVRGYTRSDGTSVSDYSRRPKGVAARDREENRESEWMRWLIGIGWLAGCGVVITFYVAVTMPNTRQLPDS